MQPSHPNSSFVIRVRWSGDTPTITLQNIGTKEVLTLTSWSELFGALYKSSSHRHKLPN